MNVAVIGAGAAGLVTAHELNRAGHEVTVIEQLGHVAGVWQYHEGVEEDLLGDTENRIHSSLYESLQTNLPRDLMAFLDFTFDTKGGGHDDWPRFPHHTQVSEYLNRFADHFDLRQIIRFNERVLAISREGSAWTVTTTQGVSVFEAVAVCNGHYAKPRVPEIEGLASIPHVMHSHNYRRPDGFRGHTVALLGASVSGFDIHREISTTADAVYLSGEMFDDLADEKRVNRNVTLVPQVLACDQDRCLHFAGGSVSKPIDTFMYCTGYHYDFPFLSDAIIVDDNWVKPLYQQLLHIHHPTLAFIGIPLRVIPFPLFQMQARWFSHLLCGDFTLPPVDEMQAEEQLMFERQTASGGKQRNVHVLGDRQGDYINLLASQCGEDPLPAWFADLAKAHFANTVKLGPKFRVGALPDGAPTVVPSLVTE